MGFGKDIKGTTTKRLLTCHYGSGLANNNNPFFNLVVIKGGGNEKTDKDSTELKLKHFLSSVELFSSFCSQLTSENSLV